MCSCIYCIVGSYVNFSSELMKESRGLKLRAASAKSRGAQQPLNTFTRNLNPVHPHEPTSNHHNGIRVESRRSHVRPPDNPSLGDRCPSPELTMNSYNRYIAVASRVVRRSLKEDKRIIAERRGASELRFAKWEVSACIGREVEMGYRVEANGHTERQAGRTQGPERCVAPSTG